MKMEKQKGKRMSLGEPTSRKKFHSLRLLNPKFHQVDSARHDPELFKELERSLERDNREEQPISEPTPEFPDDEKDIEDDTLWQSFMAQAVKVASKVQSQKVNCYEREFQRIKRDFDSHQKIRKRQLLHLQTIIKDKYKQIHCYFEQLKQQKSAFMMNSSLTKTKKNRKSQPLLITENSGKMVTLQETIDSLRREIEDTEREISFLSVKESNGEKEWIRFLRKMLREGYYLKQGAIPILAELVAVGYVPKMRDMPRCLDEVSKNCLLLEYQRIKALPSIVQSSPKRIQSQPKSKLRVIAQIDLIRDIYKQTKDIMSTLVKDPSSWKEQLILPPIATPKKAQIRLDWRQNERRRLSHVYTGEKYQISKSILFGPKVQTQG